jgi:flagellar protein FlaJ
MLGRANETILYATVYGLIPLTGAGFLVLISTVKQDELGDGYLAFDRDDEYEAEKGSGLFSLGVIERFAGGYKVFDRIKSREGNYRTFKLLKQPHIFFRENPLFVLILTFPVSLVIVGNMALKGAVPTSIDGFVAKPVWGTFAWVYLPLYINCLPLTIFYEWTVRTRHGVTANLPHSLRKLSSANETGMTLLESMKVVSETSSGKLADEFEEMYTKVNYGTRLGDAMREFNNKYHLPRLARTVKLISKAQEASSQIQDVLSTAAQASENQDDIDRDRIARTRMQVVIILMTYLTLLGVMALLKAQFLGEIGALASASASSSGGGGAAPTSGFGQSLDVDMLSMLFFHAVVLQALLSSFIAGYIRSVNVLSGVKFAVILSTIALVVWMAIG